MHVATVQRKNSPLAGRNLQHSLAQYELQFATTDSDFEKTEQIHKKETKELIQYFLLIKNKLIAAEEHVSPLQEATTAKQNARPDVASMEEKKTEETLSSQLKWQQILQIEAK